jgi:hypothetical protein
MNNFKYRFCTKRKAALTLLSPRFPPSSSRAPIAVSHGGSERGVVAAASGPQGIRGSNRHRLVVPGTYSFSHGRRHSNEEHCKEQIGIRADAMWKGLIEFTHENARLEALHV